MFLTRAEDPGLAVVDWDYNAWGWKYPPFDDDDDVPVRIAEKFSLPLYQPGMVLEGGSIDVNGAGTLLTTSSCLLNPNRNPDLTKPEIEQRLKDFIGVDQILWLGDGIEGDDTDGHIDDLTRFVGPQHRRHRHRGRRDRRQLRAVAREPGAAPRDVRGRWLAARSADSAHARQDRAARPAPPGQLREFLHRE